MKNAVISVENLTKIYRLGQIGTGTLSNDLKIWLAKARGKPNPMLRIGESDHGNRSGGTIWALTNVDFAVRQGEVLGIIGQNGAGKSTLLKILSRVTAPTSGRVRISGRLASLLEVGTGFHPELTGRENIFLNGAILGMNKPEIARKFDAIVAFAEIEKFIDTPVKRYSSGMYVRLAFAVAANLDPEILVIDEVLAVGDAAFQKKCIGKMGDVAKGGRTVLFVSHNMATIARLCERVLLLDKGRLIQDGGAEEVIAHYLRGGLGVAAKKEWMRMEEAPGNDFVRLRSVSVVDSGRRVTSIVDIREPFGVEIIFDILCLRDKVVPWLVLYNEREEHVFSAFDTSEAWRTPRPKGRYQTTAWIPGNLLNEGTHTLSASLNTFIPGGRNIRQAAAERAVAFQVVDPGEGDTSRGDYGGIWTAPIRPLLKWDTSCHRSQVP
ncbi:ABC transporter ATP-binding protein [bacterium]|nr:ABC transporter ATP-binding protein [bacterium]